MNKIMHITGYIAGIIFAVIPSLFITGLISGVFTAGLLVVPVIMLRYVGVL